MKELSGEYTMLFNAVTDTIEQLNLIRLELMRVQREAEELYISDADC